PEQDNQSADDSGNHRDAPLPGSEDRNADQDQPLQRYGDDTGPESEGLNGHTTPYASRQAFGSGKCRIITSSEANMATPWNVSGQYYETCNCDFVCPCIPGQLAVQPTKGNCQFAMAFQIERGEYGDVTL